ncbi:hypothetical protein EVAR_63251_1 [Eumeta japonica]|uniref:Uncharacterized protein n=1 Tax=Eumeta variegata TaxID=151549 RepID=A0A4C2A1G6_EUMVA|nr:hypothetical protein EVAR_63251_1 [Eumeta japonica]
MFGKIDLLGVSWERKKRGFADATSPTSIERCGRMYIPPPYTSHVANKALARKAALSRVSELSSNTLMTIFDSNYVIVVCAAQEMIVIVKLSAKETTIYLAIDTEFKNNNGCNYITLS